MKTEGKGDNGFGKFVFGGTFWGVREVDVPDCRLGQVRQFPGLVAVGDFFGFWCHVCIGSCVLEA